MRKLKYQIVLIILSILVFSPAKAQKSSGLAMVDSKGILRWEDTGKEVQGFGINYTLPFAHAYRSAKKLGIDPKEAILTDLHHFELLDFDLYRIHIWDTEISDREGNLIENEHLDTFDWLISELKQRDIRYFLTPIAFWGNGWPEPDEETPGFSHLYGKEKALTDPAAFEAQQNYLRQFLQHKNQYTGLAYKDDPDLIAVEVSNEPHHRGSTKEVLDFVSGMVEAVQSVGSNKPVFYNITHGINYMPQYLKSGINGGTFQWYPTGLGYGKPLQGNYLPNVTNYRIPFDSLLTEAGTARVVYEFDAADMQSAVMYPAMARSFREAGIQLATHFSYDPSFLAPYNTEYNTHYMNLLYTPSKALGLMIAGKIFHEIPMGEQLGGYPENNSFGNFTFSYDPSLAVYNSREEFIHTSDTDIEPVSSKKLQKISGFGNSPLVTYSGMGSYFFEKLDKGLWKLEVMPDAIPLDNPFGRNNLNRELTTLLNIPRDIEVKLHDLPADFYYYGKNEPNEQNEKAGRAKNGVFPVSPGIYLLSAKSIDPKKAVGIEMKTGFVPDSWQVSKPVIHNKTPKVLISNTSAKFRVKGYIPNQAVISVNGRGPAGWFNHELNIEGPFHASFSIPEEQLQPGILSYTFTVRTAEGDIYSWPGSRELAPWDWDYPATKPYETVVLDGGMSLTLFEPKRDHEALIKPWRPDSRLIPIGKEGEWEYRVVLNELYQVDPENPKAEPVYDYSMKHFIGDKTNLLKSADKNEYKLIIKARGNENREKLQLALTDKFGHSHGLTISLKSGWDTYEIMLDELKSVPTVILPRPYPTFLPYFSSVQGESNWEINDIEFIQFSVGPGLEEEKLIGPHEIGISFVLLGK